MSSEAVATLAVGSAIGIPVVPTARESNSNIKSLPKLYVYECCPFCIRARMIFGVKKIKFDLIFLQDGDERTPMELVGQKQTPILDPIVSKPFAESMDIVEYVNKHYESEPIFKDLKPRDDIMKWSKDGFSFILPLLNPRLVNSPLPDFAQKESRIYFQKKKEKTMGPFQDALAKTPELMQKAHEYLDQINTMLHSSEFVNEEFSIDDIIAFSSLRTLTMLKDLKWPPKVRKYLEYMSELSDIPLLDKVAC